MKSVINNGVKIIATGFIVLVFLALPLFWVRCMCERTISEMMPKDSRNIRITPCGLVPHELERDPNVVSCSYVEARMNLKLAMFLGIVNYFVEGLPEVQGSNIYYYNQSDSAAMYFDKRLGQIVCRYSKEEKMPDKTVLRRKVELYASPEGVSEGVDKAIGRFIFPIIDARARPWQPVTLYDKKLRRFFTIDFEQKRVVRGPELGKNDIHEPVQIGRISKNQPHVDLYWAPPQAVSSAEDRKKEQYTSGDLKPAIQRDHFDDAGQYLLVLDATGRIDLLDRKTLEFAGTAGWLPAPKMLFPSRDSARPQDLLAYDALPLAFSSDRQYRGMFVASVCRESTAMTLAVFGEKGRPLSTKGTLVITEYREVAPSRFIPSRSEYPFTIPGGYVFTSSEFMPSRSVPSGKAFFFGAPWAPALTIGKYLAENLHPPILSLASYFMAYSFEAGAGHRALFILPNSFVAMKGRDVRQNAVSRLGYALLLMLPSLILGIFLAWRVEKDATLVGLSESARLFWMIGTIAFGLAGYITYRLTRPKETLVSCANCGKLRRPDMEKCHHCGSKWHVPEITPPTWRVANNI